MKLIYTVKVKYANGGSSTISFTNKVTMLIYIEELEKSMTQWDSIVIKINQLAAELV